MAINTLADWNGAHARQSILGRPRRKQEGRDPHSEDTDEVQRSPATDHHIQTFFDALEAGDTSEQSHALGKIVQSWRADNNAGGLPVYAHPSLPNAFANSLAQLIHSNTDSKSAAEGVATKLEPGARISMFQQLRDIARKQVPSVTATHGNRSHTHRAADVIGDESDYDNDLTSPFVTAQAQPPLPHPPNPPGGPRQNRPVQPPGPPRRPPGVGQPQQQVRPPEWWEEPLLPPQPRDPPLRRSQSGNLVAPTNRLDPRLRAYLGSLDWYDPTDNLPRGPDGQGGGGFSGTRLTNGVRYPHGAQDRLSSPDQSIRAPVTGQFLGHGRLNNGWPYFDIRLEHNIIVRVIHSEVIRDSARNVYFRNGDTIRAGQEIGTQQRFGGNLQNVPLHTHIQIMVPIPQSSPVRYYLVDPAPYVPNPDYIP